MSPEIGVLQRHFYFIFDNVFFKWYLKYYMILEPFSRRLQLFTWRLILPQKKAVIFFQRMYMLSQGTLPSLCHSYRLSPHVVQYSVTERVFNTLHGDVYSMCILTVYVLYSIHPQIVLASIFRKIQNHIFINYLAQKSRFYTEKTHIVKSNMEV